MDTSLNDLAGFASAYETISAFNDKYHDVVLRYVNVFYPGTDIIHNIYCVTNRDDDGCSIYAGADGQANE